MKNKTALFLMTAGIAMSLEASAQVNQNTVNGQSNISGDTPSAPGKLKAPNLHISLDAFKSFGEYLLTRANTLQLDAQVNRMKAEGVTERRFNAVFSAEGALLYQHELRFEDREKWNDTGKNLGAQLIPFSIRILPTGQKKVSFSAVGFRNMNALQNSSHAYKDGDTPYKFWTIVDKLDFFTFTWDEKMTFDNIRSFDVNFFDINTRLSLLNSKDNQSYLSLNNGATVGSRVTMVDHLEQHNYQNLKRTGDGLVTFHSGLEANFVANNGVKINVQSQYVGSQGQIPAHNVSSLNANSTGQAAYDQSLQQYNQAMSQWQHDKLQYEIQNNGGNTLSDQAYVEMSNNTKPVEPYEFTPANTRTTLIRRSGMIQNSIDVSVPVKKEGAPVRLGAGLNVNFMIFDEIMNISGQRVIDLAPHYNQALQARVYVNF